MWPFASKLDRELRDKRTRAAIADLDAKLAVVNSASTASYPLSDPLAFEKLFGPSSGSLTPQQALGNGAFYRCIFLIAGCVAMLRFSSYRNVGAPDEQVETDSVQARLIGERPNPRMSLTAFWRSIVADMLMNGNGVVWIERTAAGVPLNLWWVPWGRVGINFWRTPFGATELQYHLTLDDGTFVTAAQDDVMHFGGSPQWNLLYYLSPLAAYAQATGIGISAGKYAKAYFDNGASSDSVIVYPTNKTKEQAQEIRDAIKAKLGGDNRFSGPLVLDGAATYTQLKINAADAQLLQSREFSINEIGMVLGVPPHLLNQIDKATAFGKGLEEMTQAFIDFTLGPHLGAIEDEVNWKLYGQRARAARFDRDSFIRGDLKSRSEALQTLLGGAQGPGVISQNEARGKISLPRKPGQSYDQVLGWSSPGKTPAGGDPAIEPTEPAAPAPPPNPKPKKRGE